MSGSVINEYEAATVKTLIPLDNPTVTDKVFRSQVLLKPLTCMEVHCCLCDFLHVLRCGFLLLFGKF